MNQDFKPYPATKDSGADWLGTVPKHWAVIPNRALFTEVKDRNHPDEEMLSVTITRGVVQQRTLLAGTSKKDSSNLDRTAYKLVQPGDIAYNKMRAWQGAIGVSDYRGIVSPAYVVLRLRVTANPRYFHYLFRTPHFAKEAERWSYGITSDMWSLRPEHFRLISSLLPPADEQAAIVRFLNYADRRIQEYVQLKQRLIELFEEQKRPIISRAITFGVDSAARTKSSGIDWLGDISESWTIARLGCYLRKIEQGWSPEASEGEVVPGQYSVLTLSAVKHGRFSPKAVKPISTTEQIPYELELRDGEFLLSRSNSRELVGDVCIVEGAEPRTIFPDLIYRLSVDSARLEPRYLMYALLSPIGRRQIERDARGSSGTMPKISQGHIRSWRIPLPSLGEQRVITKALDHELSKLNKAVLLAESEIVLVRELWRRLQNDVTAGKFDVRDAAIELPGEISEVLACASGEELTNGRERQASSYFEESTGEADA